MPPHVPYFRFYPSDFMNGVRGMTPQEVGVYTMILCRMYEESGPVERNILRLSTYCGMREATFEKVFEKLVALGKFQVVDGMVTNRRAAKEISDRANDLKLKSKAGKASGKKRNKNNATIPTGDEHPSNYTDTDTDTDTDIGGGDSACAGLSFREQVISAMGHDPNAMTANGKIIGGQTEFMVFEQTLADLKLSQQEAIAVVAEVTRAKPDGPATSMNYFKGALQRHAGAKSADKVVPIEGRAAPPSAKKLDLRGMLNEKSGAPK